MSEEKLFFYSNFDQALLFQSYGVNVKVDSNDRDLLLEVEQRVRKAFLNRIKIIESSNDSAKHSFGIGLQNGLYFYFQDGIQNSYSESKNVVLNFFESMVRVTVAEHAVSKVFIHAAVVGWKGKAIVIPGNSYSGKSTLVADLVRNGAEYYSDEYAVLDDRGYVHAFPRPIGIRGIEEAELQTDVTVGSLGGVAGEKPLQVGMVLLTGYQANAQWEPEILDPGRGVIEMIPHTIPIRFNTKFALSVLNNVASSALVVKSKRHDSKKFSKILLNFFDNRINCDRMT